MTQLFNKNSQKSKRRLLRNSMPKAEVVVWNKIRNKQIYGARFLRQYSIDRYVTDFYCPKLKLVIEIDGDTHFTDDAQEYDKLRTEYFNSLGLNVVRVTNDDVYTNLEGVIMYIEKTVEKLQNPDK